MPRLIGRKGNRLSFAGRGVSNGKLKSIHFGWILDLLGLQIKGSAMLILDVFAFRVTLEAATFAPSPSLAEALRVFSRSRVENVLESLE